MNVTLISMFGFMGAITLFEFGVCVAIGLAYMASAHLVQLCSDVRRARLSPGCLVVDVGLGGLASSFDAYSFIARG